MDYRTKLQSSRLRDGMRLGFSRQGENTKDRWETKKVDRLKQIVVGIQAALP